MTNSLTTTATALAPPSPITEWHAHLDLQVRAGQMAKDTATTYRQGMRKLTEWASQQESWNRTLILEWVAALKAEGMATTSHSLDGNGFAWVGNYKWGWSDHFNIWSCLGEQAAPKSFEKGAAAYKLSVASIAAA